MNDVSEKKHLNLTIAIIAILLCLVGGLGLYTFISQRKTPSVINDKPKDNLAFIKDKVSVEINSELPNVIDFFQNVDELKDFPTVSYYKDGNKASVDLSKLDSYDVKILYQNEEYNSVLDIEDTTPPQVEFKDLSIKEGDRYIGRNFIKFYSDNSGLKNYSVSYKDQKVSYITEPGEYDIALLVCDNEKNCTEGKTKLIILQNNSNKKYVTSETETVILKEEPVKYGVKKVTTAEVTYSVYDDGTKEEISTGNEQVEYDYSGFNHDYLAEMKREATTLYDEQNFDRMDVLTKVNGYRREVGLDSLNVDRSLSILATVRAMEIAYSGKTDLSVRPYEEEEWHQWKSFWTEDIFDFNFDRRKYIGENTGARYNTAETIVNAWHSSDYYNKLIIEPKYTKTGIGKYTLNGVTYWVQLFVEM